MTHEPADPPVDSYRLPTSVAPRRYDLQLEPQLGAAVFTGTCAATVDVEAPVDEIVLNALDLEIDEAWLEVDGGRVELDVSLDHALERATFTPPARLAPGPAVLHTRFRGVLNDRLAGFYRSVYRDGDGNEHVIATTQMESTDCRRAFPCWDEPEMKAVFGVTLVVDAGHTAISNAAEIGRRSRPDGRVEVQFADTMVMSTYLVAFIVGDLEVSEPIEGAAGVPIRIVTTPGKQAMTEFARECARFCLDHFERYYGIPYPGDKVDLVAIPDFAAGAMENLGAITFRETALLVDLATASAADQERVADVIAHELAHMWFGDLVTMKWWNGIWLNEAFATFMEVMAVDAWKPAWLRWTTEAVARDEALIVDSLESTRPIEYPVRQPHEA